ncbi:MAG: DUF4388 domain-containing protein [Chitinispirillaceae bacterium]|nr:DUF4388 domain-containing protein [Chitinispirillaceae bacterium]
MNFSPHAPAPQIRGIIFSFTLFLLFFSVASAAQKEIEITSFYAKVYVAPSTNANFIGLTQKGERYPILGIRDSWYYIRFKNANGWVESSQLTVIDPDAPAMEATTETSEAENASSESVDSPGAATASAGPEAPAPSNVSTASRDSEGVTSAGSVATTTASRGSAQSRSAQPRRTTPRESKSSEKKTEKKESRLRSWFTQQNLPELPPNILPDEEQTATMRYFQVRFPARVIAFLSPEAPILGMTKRGQLLPLINEGDSWCRVAFADTVGWIEIRHGRIIDPDTSLSIDYVKIGLLFGGVAVIVVLPVFLLLFMKRRKKSIAVETVANRHVLIIAESSKVIQYTLTNGTTTLERCFGEVGFSITRLRDLTAANEFLQRQTKPDVVLIDYHIDKEIVASIERICAPLGFADTILFIVYNVPDPAAMQAGTVLPKMAFLGLTFSDRDVFKLVTPMLHSTDGDAIQKSIQPSALAGDIAEGNLLEVLQFIEIGSKTGCLLVEMEKPFAIICFKNGRIIFAATADMVTGREAIFKVLDLKIGKFRFVIDKKPKESNVNLSTLEVLMEWAKAVDEAHGR